MKQNMRKNFLDGVLVLGTNGAAACPEHSRRVGISDRRDFSRFIEAIYLHGLVLRIDNRMRRIDTHLSTDSDERGSVHRATKAYDRKGLCLLCSSFSKARPPGYRVGRVVLGCYREDIEHPKYVNTMATLPQLAIAKCLDCGGYDP